MKTAKRYCTKPHGHTRKPCKLELKSRNMRENVSDTFRKWMIGNLDELRNSITLTVSVNFCIDGTQYLSKRKNRGKDFS